MGDSDKELGALLESVAWIKSELAEIKSEIKSLNQFKWRVAGGAALFGLIMGTASQFIATYLGGNYGN
jgi:hypothetical protein